MTDEAVTLAEGSIFKTIARAEHCHSTQPNQQRDPAGALLYSLRARAGGPSLEPAATKSGFSANFVNYGLAASLKRRAIVLLGDVGVGKCIFIRHLINVSANELFDHALSFYVDFGKEPALAENLECFVLESCAAQLRNHHGLGIEENGLSAGLSWGRCPV